MNPYAWLDGSLGLKAISVHKPTRHRKQLGKTYGATTLEHELILQPKDDEKATPQSDLWRKWDAFYRFCRLYSVVGTIIGVSSVSLLPLTSVRDLSPAFFVGSLKAVIPLAFGNIYVAGINQLVDVDVDKVNKPYLPLASGEYSMGQATAIVSAFGFMCLAMGVMFQSPPLFIGILVYFFLGTAYSIDLPLLRWKTNPYLAALCMVGASGLTIQLSVFYHVQKYVLSRPIVFTKSLGFSVIFFSLFAAVLAMFKSDIPDVDGDQEFGNRTFSVRHGKKKVFTLCITLLLVAYGSAAIIGASSSILLNKLVSVIGHCTLASFLWLRANSLNLNDNASVQSFYMFLWKLFNAEYVLIHFVH
ncbi:Homogentisate phytyltransferase 1, chloroplastic [Heracleum sosnowskyi]|uniref:Homogentisate phytyltransferase 1, chloroplastic n=1 Tax=Heracleum sosnowskyi TaxID=360622 RepID=A0AAD8IA19_9APIA|nr:Homogentisate phytyltransferase 1, chloroplastic [Heracleum sosnowskyi]